MMNLRPYQIEAVQAVRNDWATHQNVLGVAATGAGKTQMLLATGLGSGSMPPLLGAQDRMLVIAHRAELIQQPIERIKEFWPEWLGRAGVVMADQNEANRQIIIATVQSLRPERLRTILHYGPITHLVIDEAHHAQAASYQSVIAQLRAANPELKHLGVTATPHRADKDGLCGTYSKASFTITIKDLVKAGYLVPFKGLQIATRVSLKGVHKQGDDFNAAQLANVFETNNVLELVVVSHQEYANGRKGIAFTVSVAGAHQLAAQFNAAGISAAAVDGTTPKEERRRILVAFGRGEIMMLCNCAVLTEGFDQPDISVVHMVRPTPNKSLFTQCIGRGLRTAAGKDDCLILEYAPSAGHNVATLGDVLGMPRRDPVEGIEVGDVLGGLSFDGTVRGLDGDPLGLIATQIDYLGASTFHWGRHEGWLVLGLGKGRDDCDRILAITPPMMTDPFVLYGLIRHPGSWDWRCTVAATSDDFGALSDQASAIAEERAVLALANKGAEWRKLPASDMQIKYLSRLLRDEPKPKHMERLTKSEAAELITFYQAKQALQSAGYWR